MLVTFFFILCTLAIIHFVYERIVLPEIRLYYRNELFILRDRIREILLDKSAKDDDVVCAKILHNALNNSINRLHFLTISNRVATIKVLIENPDLRNKVQNQVNLIKNSCDNRIIDAFNESCIITNNMFKFNSLLMLIYFLPFYLVIRLIKHMFKFSTSILDAMCDRKKEDVEVLSFSSEKQFTKILTHI